MFEIAILFRSTGLIKGMIALSIYLFSCIFKTGWKAWSVLIKSWINMRFSPFKAQPAAWAQTFHTRQSWIVQVQLAEPCCQQLEWYVQSARSGPVHREWDLLSTILAPQSLKFRFKRCTGLLPRAVGCQSWHSAPWSHFWDPRSLFPPQGEMCAPLQGEFSAQGETPRLGTYLSFLKIRPHVIIPWGSEHMDQPGSWGSRSGSATKPTRSSPRSQRFWQALLSPPWGPTRELLSVCPSVIQQLAAHPSAVWEGRCAGCRACAALPCAVQKAASSTSSGCWTAREGAGGRSGPCDQCSARREASDAKSVLIMAIQGRSKIAFLILESADRKHPPC